MTTSLKALNEAIRKAGSQAKFAADLGVSQPTVHGWRRAKRAPEERCPTIEALYGIRCELLRPDTDWTRDAADNITGYRVHLFPSDRGETAA
jgi:DNA-binding transcriptional regulator YdaS (Cro superfamily)